MAVDLLGPLPCFVFAHALRVNDATMARLSNVQTRVLVDRILIVILGSPLFPRDAMGVAHVQFAKNQVIMRGSTIIVKWKFWGPPWIARAAFQHHEKAADTRNRFSKLLGQRAILRTRINGLYVGCLSLRHTIAAIVTPIRILANNVWRSDDVLYLVSLLYRLTLAGGGFASCLPLTRARTQTRDRVSLGS